MLIEDYELPLTQLCSTSTTTNLVNDWNDLDHELWNDLRALDTSLDTLDTSIDVSLDEQKKNALELITSIEAHAQHDCLRLNPILENPLELLAGDKSDPGDDCGDALETKEWITPIHRKFIAPPVSVLPHLEQEKKFQQERRQNGFSAKTVRTVLPKTPRGFIRVKNRKQWRLLGLDPYACYSTTLGVPPAKNPKKCASRSPLERKKQYQRISWCDVLSQLVENEPSIDSIGQIRDQFAKYEQEAYNVGLEEQYDFMQTELKKNELGQLQPWGPIPGTNAMGWHQYRLQHALIYLLKREVLWILRPGPLGLDYPYVKYDWDYIQWIYYENGKDGVREALSTNAFKIRFEILHPLVNQIFDIEGNGPEKKVSKKLPKINDRFSNGKLVFLDNGIGLLHPPLREGDQERASRLNAHVQECLGRHFFQWEGKNIIDPHLPSTKKKHNAQTKKRKRVASEQTIAAQKRYEERRTKGTKPIPANTLPRLFEAAYAAYVIQFPNKELQLPKRGLAAKEIALAKKRPHAAGLEDRERRFDKKLESLLC